MNPLTCRIVLVRPRDPNNIGAVARAMKNFGFRDLWVVTPHPPVWAEVVSAVKAEDVLNNARVVTTLDEAITDCNLVVGTGDRTRATAQFPLYTPRALGQELAQASYQLALVFGSEKHGLTNDDLCRCHRLLTIPTQSDCPSMNLGQSVAVCLYELVRAVPEPPPPPAEQAAAGAVEAAVQLSLEILRLADFVLPGNEPDLTRRVRAALLKYNLSKYDTDMLCGILRKIEAKIRPSTQTHVGELKQ